MARLLLSTALFFSTVFFFTSAAQANSALKTGRWEGTYICGKQRGLVIEITQASAQGAEGVFSFYRGLSTAAQPLGRYTLKFQYLDASGQFDARPVRWILKPAGFHAVGFRGKITQNGALAGIIQFSGCKRFQLAYAGKGQNKNTAQAPRGSEPQMQGGANPSRQPRPVQQNTPLQQVSSLQDIRGIWSGILNVGGFDGRIPVKLTITKQGALLNYQGMMQRCRIAISPDKNGAAFKALVFSSKGNSCATQKIRLALEPAGGKMRLHVVSPDFKKNAILTRKFGPVDIRPDRPRLQLDFVGVKLGQPLSQLKQMTNAPKSTYILSQMQRFSPRGVCGGSAFCRGTPLDATLQTTYWPAQGSKGPKQIYEDALTGYALKDKKISALLRFYKPFRQNAPTASATLNALTKKYGRASENSVEGRMIYLNWYFDKSGRLLSGAQKGLCKATRAQKKSLISTYVMMKTQVLKVGPGYVRPEDKYLTQYMTPLDSCGYTLSVKLRKRNDNSLEEMTTFVFDHQEIASHLWSKYEAKTSSRVMSRLRMIERNRSNKPKL